MADVGGVGGAGGAGSSGGPEGAGDAGGTSGDGGSTGADGGAAAGFDGAVSSAKGDDGAGSDNGSAAASTDDDTADTSSKAAAPAASNIDAAMLAASVEDDGQTAAPAIDTPPAMSVPAYAVGDAVQTTGRAVLDANPALSKDWVSYESNVPHRSYSGPNVGFTDGVSTRLDAAGINELPDRPVPPGLAASNANRDQPGRGAVARDAVANDYRTQGYDVRTEVTETTRLGDRRVDVVAEKPGVRIDTEVKVGRVDANSRVRGEIAKDAAQLADNRTMRTLGSTLDGVGKVAKPVGVVMDAVSLHQAYRADGNQIGDNTLSTASGVAGGAVGGGLGMWGGAAAGAMVGGPVGAVIGGLIGAFGGSLLGDWGGRSAYEAAQ